MFSLPSPFRITRTSLLGLVKSIYYIHTEKYSPKSYVVNFRTQISSSQSEERTMVFTREKNDTSNQNSERCFFTCEKNDTSNQRPQRCVSFAPKFPPFIAACRAASYTFNEKIFTQRVSLSKKSENILEMEWNSFCLLYTSPSPRDATLSRMPSSA